MDKLLYNIHASLWCDNAKSPRTSYDVNLVPGEKNEYLEGNRALSLNEHGDVLWLY